ncbi:ChbG/HpnK family deacetylase [Microvirga pudoricolor]|uniref:ChbG/HpnK family deacetylase n=1 Tax=Microvirga pudoricolor TaxID=2778729 RepID=UPI0019517271|nr:ChbG/HpnK family deacetylase [Microvirga pudoricolor]MBM6592420.1 ChbG/HpnK family deacetylase [Microvirga pudoricolor]
MNLPRPVVLCADDFGLTDGISRAIVELAEGGRVSATGAMTNMPGWRRNAASLQGLKGRIGIGLHLNLTVGEPLAPMPGVAPGGALLPLGRLLRGTFLRSLPVSELKEEIGRQVDAFEQVHGAAPDFVDGHQHVHVLPGIRQALLEVLVSRGYPGRVWLRDPTDAVTSILKRAVSAGKALTVQALASGFRREAEVAGFETNRGFSGFSPLEDETDAGLVIRAAFERVGPKPLIMCHPGYVDDELRALDPVVESRAAERAFLASFGFEKFLSGKGFALVPRPTAR